jgi:hypothetical protein
MSDRLRALLLAMVLGGCGGDSSTSVVVAVDNSIDGEEGDPNLIVVIRHDDDDDDDVAPAPHRGLQGAVEAASPERQDSRNAVEPDLAYVAFDAGDRPRSVALAGAGGETFAELGLEGEAGVTGLAWSRDRRTVYLGDPEGLRVWRGGAGAAWLVAVPGAIPLDAGPLLEASIDGGILGFEVVLASAPAGGDGAADLFAIFVDASGAVLGVQNLTGTPESAEIDAAWLADGSRIALLERSGRDAIAVREISIEVERTGMPRASLAATGTTLWAAGSGTLADLSAARSGDLLALAAWTGADWDVLCVEPSGVVVNLGSSALDELSPSWSPDGRSLALEQRCTGDACAARPILVWGLGSQDDPARCPQVHSAREIGGPGAWPAWRP